MVFIKTETLAKENSLTNYFKNEEKKEKKYIPVHSINLPNGGPQKTCDVAEDTPIYSSITGEFIQNGPIKVDTPNDAPVGHPNHGGKYHVIIKNPTNGSFMAHRSGKIRKRK